MPRIINFDSKQTVEPGSYAKVIGGAQIPAVTGTYGSVMLVDSGSGNGYGWGAGIVGEFDSNQNAVYEFNTALDAKKALKGGLLWDLVDYLFSPSNSGGGVKKLIYTRAATTVAAKKTLTFSSGVINVGARSEGVVGNGVLTGSVLTKGYSMKLSAGIIDSAKFILTFYEGQYRGQDALNGNAEYDLPAASCVDTAICKSTEFSNVNQLIAWMASDYTFNLYFKLVSSTGSATSLTGTDVTNFSSHQLFTAGTTVYSSTAMDAALNSIEDLDFSMFMCDDYDITQSPSGQNISDGANKGATSVYNTKILSHINNNATFTEKIMFVGGGSRSQDFDSAGNTGSMQIAAYYDSDAVVVVHSGVRIPMQNQQNVGLGYKVLPSLYHAAMWCGLNAGLEPQVPCTYKRLRIIGLQHELKKYQREQALLGGVGHCRYVQGMGWVVNQGVTSLQVNNSLVKTDGSSPEISIVRIKHQLNKELVLGSTPLFVGGNLNTSSAEDVKVYTQSYLSSKTATRTQDNLIMRSEGVTVTLSQDVWQVKYCFVANGPVNRMFYTGVALDPKISL